MAEQELSAGGGRLPAGTCRAPNEATGSRRATGPGSRWRRRGGRARGRARAGWPRTAHELAGSALVSHPPAQTPGVPLSGTAGVSDPGPKSGSRGFGHAGPMPVPSYDPTSYEPTGFDPATTPFGGLAEDAETRKKEERKKRGGRRVREAEERRAAKNGAENASAASALGGTMATYPDTAHGVLSGSGSFPGHGGHGAGPGRTGPPAPSAAAGGWGAGALGGLAWAGPIAEIQRSASSDALAHARVRGCVRPGRAGAPARGGGDVVRGGGGGGGGGAPPPGRRRVQRLCVRERHRRAGRARGPRCSGGGDIGIRGWTTGRGAATVATGTVIRGVSVPRPAFGRPALPGARPSEEGPSASASAAGCGPPRGPRRRRERRRSRRVPAPAHARTGARGGAALSPGGAAATLVAAAALEDD